MLSLQTISRRLEPSTPSAPTYRLKSTRGGALSRRSAQITRTPVPPYHAPSRCQPTAYPQPCRANNSHRSLSRWEDPSPLELMQRLATRAPRSRLSPIRSPGVRTPHAKLRSQIIPIPRGLGFSLVEPPQLGHRPDHRADSITSKGLVP